VQAETYQSFTGEYLKEVSQVTRVWEGSWGSPRAPPWGRVWIKQERKEGTSILLHCHLFCSKPLGMELVTWKAVSSQNAVFSGGLKDTVVDTCRGHGPTGKRTSLSPPTALILVPDSQLL
jgi:hypothetical protein